MDMIGLDCQFDNLPFVCLCHFTGNLFKSITHQSYQYLAPPLRTEDDVVQDMMNRMLFMNILLITHVYSILQNNVHYQHSPTAQAPNKERPFIPHLKDRGFLGGFL